MKWNNLHKRLKRRVWSYIVRKTKESVLYHFLYKSYWNYLFYRKEIITSSTNFYTAIPNPGAGIGHQMANWIAGYWFAQQFQLSFAHIPFSTSKWESFLGFGEGEITVEELLRKGYKKVRLPLFDEFNAEEVALQQKIMASYADKKIVFIAEQDQGYKDQFGVREDIKEKFHSAPARINEQLIFDSGSFNIAIHVRRGDIVIGQQNRSPNLLLRWQGNDYFEKLLRNVIENVKTKKPITIYFFSQGKKTDFPEFEQFENLHFCLEMNAQSSFLHMVNADLLITSKSSFSYKPALLSNGIKICPKDFWHGYPDITDWILVNKEGSFNVDQLKTHTIKNE